MADWPISLPAPLVDGCSFEPQENMVRTQMESGAAKVRRRFTRVPEDVKFGLVLDRGQVQVLSDFVTLTLSDVLPFNWREFRQPNEPDNVAVYRFKSRPKYSPLGGNLWNASIELELITAPKQGTFSISDELLQTLTQPDGTELTT